MQSLLIISTALWLAFGALTAQAKAPEISQYTLENGLRVIIIEDSRTPAISHNLLFTFGAADDPRGKSGLAHYMEHMLFQGTEKYKPNDYSKLIAAKGGQTNAFTTADYTGYWVNIAKDNLPLVMELEADRWENLNPIDAEFDKEKQVILEERRSRVENNPVALFAEQLNAMQYLHHPYGTPIIGWANEMESLTKADVMQYYTSYQHPANAVLILSGDITRAEAEPLIEKYYAPVKSRGEKVPARVQEPTQLAARTLTMQHPLVKQAQWSKSYVTPSYGWNAQDAEEHFVPLMIADYLLGGSRLSRLYTLLVEQKSLATSVSTDFNAFRMGPGEFSLNVTPNDVHQLPEIQKIIAEEFEKLKQTPPSQDELQRAKTQLIASNTYLQDGLQSLARVMGHLSMIGLPLDYYFNWESQIDSVTAQQVSDSLALLDENYSAQGTLKPAEKEATSVK